MKAWPRLLHKVFFPADGLRNYVEARTPDLPIIIRPIASTADLLNIAKLRLKTFREPKVTTETLVPFA